jgi:hypothetical protein
LGAAPNGTCHLSRGDRERDRERENTKKSNRGIEDIERQRQKGLYARHQGQLYEKEKPTTNSIGYILKREELCYYSIAAGAGRGYNILQHRPHKASL